MNQKRLFTCLLSCAALFAFCRTASAQWQSQSILIKPGWTAIYLHVDPSYTNLDYLVGTDQDNPISEVWLWQPPVSFSKFVTPDAPFGGQGIPLGGLGSPFSARPPVSTIQFVTSPTALITGSSHWATWTRGGASLTSTLYSMVPNAGYLIHSLATTNYIWTIKGRPTAPSYVWAQGSANLVGFPTVTSSPPNFDTFLSLVPDFKALANIFQFVGGNQGPSNPAQVFATYTVPVTRGQAYWIGSGAYYNDYFGPFQVSIDNHGADFGDSTSLTSFHLRNPTPSPVTIQLRLLASEASPGGQAPIAGVPPLVVRGILNTSNLTYSVSNLSTASTLSWTLTPKGQSGSDIVVFLGVDRVTFANKPAGLYAGILKFTDTRNFTEVDVPVSAMPTAYSGLWVGAASVSQVAAYLKTYQLDSNNKPALGPNGAYLVTGTNTNLGDTASPFPLRLILHNDGTNVVLLQRVFFGSDIYSNSIVTTRESSLDPSKLSSARRITAVQFPWTRNNNPWALSGRLLPGAALSTIADVSLPYTDQAGNPFLHTFHPDHDNLDHTTTPPTQLARGLVSYDINRHITLTLNPVGTDFDSLTRYGRSFQGAYNESITLVGIGGAPRTFNVAGTFLINRVSPIAVLTGP